MERIYYFAYGVVGLFGYLFLFFAAASVVSYIVQIETYATQSIAASAGYFLIPIVCFWMGKNLVKSFQVAIYRYFPARPIENSNAVARNASPHLSPILGRDG